MTIERYSIPTTQRAFPIKGFISSKPWLNPDF